MNQANVIDVETKLISVGPWPEEKRTSSSMSALRFFLMAIGSYTSFLWLASKLGLGHFVLYFGAEPINAIAHICGA